MQRVLVLGRIHQAGIERLTEAGRFDIVERPDNPPDLKALVPDVDAIIVRTTRIDRPLIAAAGRLTLVARHGVGYDAVDVDALSERNIPLALVGDVNSTAVAEHALALMLDVAKFTTAYDRAIRQGEFRIRDRFAAVELSGRTVLIIGLGRIGRKVAALCRAFGMTVIGSDPFVSRGDAEALGVTLVEDWREQLPSVDVVTVHAPKLPGEGFLIGERELQAMKRGSILINVSRGGMVDEAALIRALDEGRLMGAGLDVFEREPLPPDDPLARHPAVVLSPHSAAFTQDCARRMSLACAENVIACHDGKLDPALVVNAQVLSPGKA